MRFEKAKSKTEMLLKKADDCLELAKDQQKVAEKQHDIAARQLDLAATQLAMGAKQHEDADAIDHNAKALKTIGEAIQADAGATKTI